ncbi:MAG: hypothetical protein R3B13_29230 [Polyangiaceae bacterium]
MRASWMFSLALALSGCAGAPSAPPKADEVAAAEPDPPTPRAAADASKPVEVDAGSPDSAPIYTEPPPQVVRRHHVFATMKARAAKKVVITSVLTTAADEGETLAVGTQAVLEFKPKGEAEWVQVADVVVKEISTKGKRVLGNERQEITLEIQTLHEQKMPGKRNPFQRNARVRLQVDRMEAGGDTPAK